LDTAFPKKNAIKKEPMGDMAAQPTISLRSIASSSVNP